MTSNEQKNTTASLHEKLKKDEAETPGQAGLLDHPGYIELQQKLTETEGKANQYWERLLRVQAETDNALRRAERDVAMAHKYALEKFVSELLPIIDSLERAVSIQGDDSSSVIEGVNMTLQMFYTALEKFGVAKVDPLSQPFNPEHHQAISTHEAKDVPAGTVLNVLQKGYLLNNRLIRPALVVVAK